MVVRRDEDEVFSLWGFVYVVVAMAIATIVKSNLEKQYEKEEV